MCITVSNLIQNLPNLQNKFVASVQRCSACGCFTKIVHTFDLIKCNIINGIKIGRDYSLEFCFEPEEIRPLC